VVVICHWWTSALDTWITSRDVVNPGIPGSGTEALFAILFIATIRGDIY